MGVADDQQLPLAEPVLSGECPEPSSGAVEVAPMPSEENQQIDSLEDATDAG